MDRERKWKELIEKDDKYRKEQEKKKEAIRKLEEEYNKALTYSHD